MSALGINRYGKEKVRVLRKHVDEDGKRQTITEISADVLLEGSFEKSYLSDDNSQIVATDTCKNTIIALAHQHLGPCIEDFALTLGSHFLDTHAHVDRVHVELREFSWERLTVDGADTSHSFQAAAGGEPFTRLTACRDKIALESGLRKLTILNATNSSFVGFDHTAFTTLQDASDRILSTELAATWTYADSGADHKDTNSRVRGALLEVFAKNFSPSVQRTLFEMGDAALAAAPEIADIHLSMPNKHYFLADLSPFDLENPNLTFLPQNEPHGQIEATVTR